MKMMDLRSLWTLALLIACCGGASKYYSGENKPYEFGFKLDGEQHRHETKDANGIIMGEFGFITADGVYHVTVYATDENGNFKIISMKNIRVQPYPGSKADAPERRPNPLSAPENSLPAPENSILPQGPSSPGLSAPSPLPIASPVKSCSHCSLPTTTTLRPANVQNNLGPDYSLPQQNPFNSAGPHVLPLNAPEPVNVPSNYELFPPYSNDRTPSVNLQTPNTGFGPANNQNYPSNNALVPGNNALVPGNNALVPGNNALVPGNNALEPGNNALVPGNNALVPGNNALVPGNNPLEPGNNQNNNANNVDNLIKQHEEVINNYNSQHAANKPTLITADLQRVQGQTNIHASAPGERDGLINGLNNGDMLELLYTFNYTLGFHGHHERGYRNGEKKGYYYVTGRDGVRLRVDYVADSTGYHPRISQEVFGLDAPEVPKPETEQNAEFGLKGYEFKWLYFPPGEQSGR